MLNAVPAPELMASTTNWSRYFPDKILSHAWTIALPRFLSIAPAFMLAIAAERFIITNDFIRFG